ncbi:integrase [Bordetella petrii]|uniref:integrase n=1 Tax=Bordetella petrii TaxID=94624 RepID=UPI001A96301B|nr:integrase [Bordetella petrii]MBO1110673.1 integrase [Bordetella petrii]
MDTTKQSLSDLKPGTFLTLRKVKPTGALQARKQANGAIMFYWRYSMGTKSERVLIGQYRSTIPPKQLDPDKGGRYSIAAAERAAEKKATDHHNHRDQGGWPALREQKIREQQELREAQEAAERAKRAAGQFTLARLCDEYCKYLKALKRDAHRDAASIFNLHIKEAWPDMADRPANGITTDNVADMMRRLHELGKGRTANKLRSYLRSAYQIARAARTKPAIPILFKNFDITTNPAADAAPDESKNRTDKDELSDIEMRTYWRIIRDIPDLRGAMLRLHLLTGGQRIAQLVRLRNEDIGESEITIYDGKGRPGREPRAHILPLTKAAAAAIKNLPTSGTYAISTDGGETHVAPTTLSRWAAEIVGDKIPRFKLKRVRSGVETILAKASVSKDTRGRLLSHGISGVQDRSYDAYDYINEKRTALETLNALLQRKPGNNIVTLPARTAGTVA